ncbi:NmrA family NAD(P)-binding protein [Dyella choica]|uniref:NAD-dependent epimerase/dehydratase family protein n=1 Tax=Dyella choica TaxID=1927959 RepID=A0A432LZH6_9GAMM|nr:NmrA family NAD(P)-binding protein [Dyella choica]RUL69184.1 NAD-dependent epimerase/dehydratase family protein [Dyella choica]
MVDGRKVILVVGANGRSGGMVARYLARNGFTVRALSRSESAGAKARANGASEVAMGDLRDPASLDAALQGVDGVFHVGPPFAFDEAQMGVSMVRSAERAGVRKFVFSAAIHPANGLSNHASKLPVIEAVTRSRMDFTILYPATYYQNLDASWGNVVTSGVFVEPFPGDVRIARVDYRDVAQVVVEAFHSDRLAYGSFELCADEMPDRPEIAALMSEALGHTIIAAEVRFEAWAAALQPSPPPDLFKQLEIVYRSYAQFGSPGNSLVLRSILGRKPRTLGEYFRELAG